MSDDLSSEIERAVFDHRKALSEKLLQSKRGEEAWSASLRDAALSGLAFTAALAVSVLVAELRAGVSSDQEIPSSGLTGEAAPIIINSPGARVTVNTSQASGNGSSVANFRDEEFNKSVRRRSHIWGAVVGVMTIGGAAAAIVELFV